MEQVINLGQFVAAEIIVLLIIGSVEKLTLSLENIYDILTALEKIGQVTDIELDSDEGVDLAEECKENGMDVELSGINFTYPDYPNKSLNNLSLNIAANEKILLVGPNGSGKTTLLNIIAGFYNVQEGQLLYNNIPKSTIKMNSLRSIIGDCMTQGHLFEGTIFENISMGREPATKENVKWAVDKMNLNEFIKSLPKGLETFIEPQGKKLPRSIIEKLLMARGIADKPKLLLVEDAFEHIDEKDRLEIINFLTSDEVPWTLVAVSLDKNFASKMNRVILLNDGSISKIGSYEEMKKYIN
jgi:ABC-type bacteriocin/lantibiotic exporter with double-glycine peptidase domain